MHKSGIVHRDLNTNNILVDIQKNQIKIIDFNVAKDCLNSDKDKDTKMQIMDNSIEITDSPGINRYRGIPVNDQLQNNYNYSMMTHCGTPAFKSPE